MLNHEIKKTFAHSFFTFHCYVILMLILHACIPHMRLELNANDNKSVIYLHVSRYLCMVYGIHS